MHKSILFALLSLGRECGAQKFALFCLSKSILFALLSLVRVCGAQKYFVCPIVFSVVHNSILFLLLSLVRVCGAQKHFVCPIVFSDGVWCTKVFCLPYCL